MNSLKLSKRVIGFALSVLFVNVALADANSDARIQAYKANKLIPQNIVLPTSTNASDTQEIVAFSSTKLSWNSGTASQLAMNALASKYAGYTIEDLSTLLGYAYDVNTNYGWVTGMPENITPQDVDEILQYLSWVANNKISSDSITASEAMEQLQAKLSDYTAGAQTLGYTYAVAFPCEGLDFTGISLNKCNLMNATGLTAEQIASVTDLSSSILPAITFTGTEDLSGINANSADLSNCIGITGIQLTSMGDITYATLPECMFNGNETFTGRDLTGVDLSKCNGITASQILSATSLRSTILPNISFNGTEDFSNKMFSLTDLSKCTGITGAQLMSAATIQGAKLPTVAFTGTEDFSGKYLGTTDMSQCTGITASQILSVATLPSKLPAIAFNGNESFEGKSLSSTDFSKCTGITAAQIGSTTSVSNMRMTTAQYNEWKSTLQSKFKNKYVYVDGVRTKIQ